MTRWIAVWTLSCVLGVSPALADSERELVSGGADVEDFNHTGAEINGMLKKLSKGFVDVDPEFMRNAFHDELAAVAVGQWQRAPIAGTGAVVAHSLSSGPPAPGENGIDAVIERLLAVRAEYSDIDTSAFKLHKLHQVRGDGSASAAFRIEVVGTRVDGRRGATRAVFESEWKPFGAHLAMVDVRLVDGESVVGSGAAFEEQAAARGIEFEGVEDPRFLPPSDALKFQILRHAVGGASAGDANGDGFDDVLMTGGGQARLFLNKGDGSFRDATAEWGLTGIAQANASVFADFDNDGDQDLYVARFYGQNRLFENTGSTYRDVTERSGLALDDMTSVLAVADIDNDGALDLYLGRFLDARVDIPSMVHYSRNGAPNRLYRGNGDLTFVDVSQASGADDVGLTLGIAIADYDRDGDQDIYLANDFGRNVLLRNRGDGTFEDVARATGALAISGGMSASWGDYDGDGWLDLYVSSVRSNQRWFSQGLNLRGYILRIVESERRDKLQELFVDLQEHLGDDWDQIGQRALAGNYLLRNNGDGTFSDVSDEAEARPQGWYWSSGFFDADNDGDQDVLAINGFITGDKLDDL